MSEECKKARNTVVTTTIILLTILLFCSSCSSTRCASAPNSWGSSCAAYR